MAEPPPRRRSHIKSQTYLNLVKILSIRYGNSPLASAPPIIPLDLIQDKGNNQEGQETVKEMEPRNVVCLNDKQPSELVAPDIGQHENLCAPEDMAVDENLQDTNFLDRQLSSTQITINDIEKMMQTEENRDDWNQNGTVVHESAEQTGLQGGDFGLEDMLMNELENIMKGNEEPGRDESAILFPSPLDENHCLNFVAATSMTNQEEDICHQQPIVKECGLASVCEGGQEDFQQKRTESADSIPDRVLPVIMSKPDGIEEGRPLPKTVEFEAWHANLQKEMDCEKLLGSSAVEILPGHIVEDGEIEEGEISGEYGTESINWLSEDDVVSGHADLNEKQLNAGKFNDLPSNSQNKHNLCESEPTFCTTSAVDSENRVSEIELTRKANGANLGLNTVLALPNHLTLHSEILKQSSGKEAVTSQKKDAGARDNKKSSRKKRKKEKDREKRAIENQKLGVKRLKLQTVMTPKTIRTCKHYLVGRCYEGEKCRFSHDEVPLTKSTPCTHFARNSCMKGDTCPFDHELSKYPCTNYTSSGFCPRGDSCLFSHKMLPPGEAPSSSNARGSGLKASLPADSNCKKQLNVGGTKIQRVNVAAFTQKNAKPNVAEIHALPPSQAAKPASSIFAADSSVRHKLPPKRNNSIRDKGCASDTAQAANGSPKITQSMAPRGINFLSFGKATSRDSKTGDRTGALSKERELNQMVEKIQPVITPTGINFLSPGIAPIGFLGNHREVTSPSTYQRDKDQSSHENRRAPIKYCNLNSVSLNLRASPLAPGQSLKLLEHKNSPNSARKALMSTLDFAAKFDGSKNRSAKESQPASDHQQNSPASPLDASLCSGQQAQESRPNSAEKSFTPPLACAATLNSEMKKYQSTGNTFSVRAQPTGCSGNKSADTSNFLEFLSSFSSKRKQ